jgi:hypothetical protein
MPARLAAAVTAAVLAVSLTAVTAGATVARTPGPQHKCEASADPIEHKCDEPQHKCDSAEPLEKKCNDT